MDFGLLGCFIALLRARGGMPFLIVERMKFQLSIGSMHCRLCIILFVIPCTSLYISLAPRPLCLIAVYNYQLLPMNSIV